MAQCPSCNSYNEATAVFCSQCGARLDPASSGSRRLRGRTRRKVPLVTTVLILAALVLVFVVSRLPRGARVPLSSTIGPESAPRTAPPLSGEGAGEGGAVEPSAVREPPPAEPLTAGQASRLVARALVVLDLRSEDGRQLREERGILVDSSGVVLSRLSPLLGAYQGTCRLSHPEGRRLDIAGVVHSDDRLDLSLIRLEPSPIGYAEIPLLLDPPTQVLAPGETLFLFNAFEAVPAAIEATYAVRPDGVARVLLQEDATLSPLSFLAVDAFGYTVGLCSVEVDGRLLRPGENLPAAGYRILVDPAYSLGAGLGRPVMTLAELSRRLFEGTFKDYFVRGTLAFQQSRWREAVDLFESALARAPTDGPSAEDLERLERDLREGYLQEIQRLAGEGRTGEAAALAESAFQRYPNDPVFMVLLGEARYVQGDWGGGILALAQAREIETSQRLDSLLEKGYLELANEAARRGDARAQESNLLDGIRQVGNSGILHLELARLYARYEAYDDAIRLLEQARQLDSSLRESAENLLAKIEEVLRRREAVIVPVPPGSGSIRTTALIDGRTEFTFVIDTGATYTSIPSDLAAQLRYDTSVSRRVNVSAVGGIFNVPLITIQSLNLGGYVVRNLEVLVVPQSIGPNFGLLGLNFLRHFKYTVDSKRNEFRLERL